MVASSHVEEHIAFAELLIGAAKEELKEHNKMKTAQLKLIAHEEEKTPQGPVKVLYLRSDEPELAGLLRRSWDRAISSRLSGKRIVSGTPLLALKETIRNGLMLVKEVEDQAQMDYWAKPKHLREIVDQQTLPMTGAHWDSNSWLFDAEKLWIRVSHGNRGRVWLNAPEAEDFDKVFGEAKQTTT